MAAVVVDTDVASYLHKKDSRARLFRSHLIGRDWIVSFMTVAELYEWAEKRRWGPAERERLDRHLNRFIVYSADDPLYRQWARVRTQADQAGRPIDKADAWIAATAVALGVPLATNNADDFAGVRGLRLLTAMREH